MKKKTIPGTCPFGARVLLAHLDNLQKEFEGAKNAADIEHIHQLRVFSRRLRSAFPLFFDCMPMKKAERWLSEIKGITTQLGQARDLDVQIEFLTGFRQSVEEKRSFPGIKRLILRLNQKRTSVQQKVIKSLEKFEASQTAEEITAHFFPLSQQVVEGIGYPVELYQLAARSISAGLDTLHGYDSIVQMPECVKELHEMRIAAKALRYTIETFAPIYQSQLKNPYLAVKKAQELLGNIHDMDVWEQYLPIFIEKETKRTQDFYGNIGAMNFIKPGVHHFLEFTRLERERIYQQFVVEWEKWKTEGTWDNLSENIRMPSYPKDAVQPAPADISGE